MYQGSLWMVLAATLQLWFILNLLLVFVRILDLTQLCFILNLLLMCVGILECFCFCEEIFYVAQHVLEVWQFGQVG